MLRKITFLLGIFVFSPIILSAADPELSRFNMMVDKADIIFRGTVIAKEYRDVGEGAYEMPFTFYTFNVHEEFKGESPDGTLVVRIAGGISPSTNRPSMMSGYPAFSLGEEYLVFLEGNGEDGNPIISNGVLWISRGPKTGNSVLISPSGMQVMDFDDNGPVFTSGRIVKMDQPYLDMYYEIVDTDDIESGGTRGFVDEVVLNHRAMLNKVHGHIASRRLESTYIQGKRVNHAVKPANN